MIVRNFRAVWLHSMIGSMLVLDRTRNVMWRVFVAVDNQRRIVGFYSLSSFTLAITDLPREYAKGRASRVVFGASSFFVVA